MHHHLTDNMEAILPIAIGAAILLYLFFQDYNQMKSIRRVDDILEEHYQQKATKLGEFFLMRG